MPKNKKPAQRKASTKKAPAKTQTARAPKCKTKIIQSNMTKKASHNSGDPFSSGNTVGNQQITVNFASEQGRRGQEIASLASGPIATSIVNMTVARRRSRHAVLTNAYAKRGIDILVSNVVGEGHNLISLAPKKIGEVENDFSEQVEELWEEWSEQVDVTGKLNFAAFERLAFRSMIEGGDSFVRLRTRRPEDGLAVPLQLQMFESEQVPAHKNEVFNNDRILAGIQFSPLGEIKFYHMYRSHPGDFTLAQDVQNTINTTPVPAQEVIHLHDVRRPNEVRGLPVLSQSLIQLSDLDTYMDAELVRKKAAALIGGFIRQPDGDLDKNPFITVEGTDENEDYHIEPMEPGSFPVLPPGYEVSFSNPADVGPHFNDFLKQQLMMVAAALNITFEQLTGDTSDANERTIRATMLEFKRIAQQYQNAILAHQFCRNVFNKWFDLALLSGALTIPEGMTMRQARKVKWASDPWEYLNPLQEVNVEIKKVRAGIKSRTEVIRESGRDPEEVEQMIIDEREREKENGLVFDTNPEAVSLSGVVQTTDPTDNFMTEEEKEERAEKDIITDEPPQLAKGKEAANE